MLKTLRIDNAFANVVRVLDRDHRVVGKVVTSSICFSLNGRTVRRVNTITP